MRYIDLLLQIFQTFENNAVLNDRLAFLKETAKEFRSFSCGRTEEEQETIERYLNARHRLTLLLISFAYELGKQAEK